MRSDDATAPDTGGQATLDPVTLGQTLSDFAVALASEPGGLIAAFDTEPHPDMVALVYHPPAAAPRAQIPGAAPAAPGGVIPGTGGTSGPSDGGAAVPAAPGPRKGITPISANLPANFVCELCEGRMYPVRKFQRPASGNTSRPILVLYHSGSFGRGPARLDRSRDFIFGSPEEDDLFSRMLGAVQLQIGDLNYQEYPACHFNAVRSTPEDWSERGEHCRQHVRKAVNEREIRLLILTGPAAVILLGPEQARALAESSSQTDIDLGEQIRVPALVMRSPAALIALEQRRLKLKAGALNSPDAEAALRKAVAEEKQIKTQVVAALKASLAALGSG